MKVARWIAFALVGYVGLVVLFESLIGYFQPTNEGTLVISTTDAEGQTSDRVVSRLESGDKLYVAANHWPRAWYRAAMANPEVEATLGDERRPYLAVRVEGAEYDRVDGEHTLPLFFRFLTGFPPRHLVRLDPR